MIEPVKRELEPVIYNEYIRAKEIHGDEYHSPHEAYAVLLEEFDEAVQVAAVCQKAIESMDAWKKE